MKKKWTARLNVRAAIGSQGVNGECELRGYVDWHYWVYEESKTHERIQCDLCKLWHIWKKRPNAFKRVVNNQTPDAISHRSNKGG